MGITGTYEGFINGPSNLLGQSIFVFSGSGHISNNYTMFSSTPGTVLFRTTNSYNITNYKFVRITGIGILYTNTNSVSLKIGVSTQNNGSSIAYSSSISVGSATALDLNISSLSGMYFIYFYMVVTGSNSTKNQGFRIETFILTNS